MPLQIASFPNPHDPANPLTGAYAWLAVLALDLRGGTGRIEFLVNPNAAAAQALPVGTIDVALGQDFGGGNRFPTSVELMSDPAFAAAFNVIATKLYTLATQVVPQLKGATTV